MTAFIKSNHFWIPVILVAASWISAAVHGIVKDEAGHPIAGALVVGEGTDLSAVTDAQGKFELSTAAIYRTPSLRIQMQKAQIHVDGLGRYQRNDGAYGRRLLAFSQPQKKETSSQGAKAIRKVAAQDLNLLVSGGGYFGGLAPVDPNSTAEATLVLEGVAQFSQANATDRQIGDLPFSKFNDSIMQIINVDSKDNAVCMDGKVKLMADTSTNYYKIVGKTLYLWDTDMASPDDFTATVLSSGSGQKLGTWSFNGMSQPPIPIPDSLDLNQASLDSILELQRNTIKYSGTVQISQDKIHNDLTFGFCIGPMLASSFTEPPLMGMAKNCNEIQMINGSDSALWSFEFKNESMKMTFTYKDSSCVTESPASLEPKYDCTDIADGETPEDTANAIGSSDMSSLVTCPAFIKFVTGGIDIPIDGFPGGLPIDSLGLGLEKKSAMPMSLAKWPNPIALQRQLQKHRVPWKH